MDFDEIQAAVCNKMKEIRLDKGMTQEDFEVETDGITSRKIRSIEALTETNLELRTLLKFCKLAGIHPQYLFDIDIPWSKRSKE